MKLKLPWKDIRILLKAAPPGKLYGVPRGGSIVAGMTGRAVDTIEECDVIVNDIIDSGETEKRYAKYKKPFWCLVNKADLIIAKQDIAYARKWVSFPWEESDSTIDLEELIRRQIEWIGEDSFRDGLKDTPKRVLKAFKQMTVGYDQNPKDILSTVFKVKHDELIILKNIRFTSICEHHLLPFTGFATVGYLPGEKIVGLSKLARLVHCHAKRLQVQERLTQDIAKDIDNHLLTRGTAVVIKATHHCMVCRGIEIDGASMITSSMTGEFRSNIPLRTEFLALLNNTL